MKEKIRIQDFPSFVRFELDIAFRRKIFSKSFRKVGGVVLDVSTEKFWTPVEEELDLSRYDLIFGKGKGGVLKALSERPLTPKEILEKNKHLSEFFVYRCIGQLSREGLIRKRKDRWNLAINYFDKVKVSDLAKVLDKRDPKKRRKYGISKNGLKFAAYLWPKYEETCAKEDLDPDSMEYGKTYLNHFSLAKAINEWESGERDIPQWALVAVTELAGISPDEEEAILGYHLPPGTKISAFYRGEYKLPISASLDLDLLTLQILAKGAHGGLSYNHKHKNELIERLRDTFGYFRSEGIPSVIVEIIRRHYEICSFEKSAVRIPQRMKERWENMPEHKKLAHYASVLELMLKLASHYNNLYELTSQSRPFLEDIVAIFEELGVDGMEIHKRSGRPHYRCIFSQKKLDVINGARESAARHGMENSIGSISDEEMDELLDMVRELYGDKGVKIVSSLAISSNLSDSNLARMSGLDIRETRAMLYELMDGRIVTYTRRETRKGLREFRYLLNQYGIKNTLEKRREEQRKRVEEESVYPFPEEWISLRGGEVFG